MLITCLAFTALAEAPFHRSVWHPELTEVRLSELELRLSTGVLEVLTQCEPVVDSPLVEAARVYARHDGNAGDALMAAGVSDTYVVPLRFSVRGADALGPVRDLLKQAIDRERPTHFGVGLATVGRVTTAAVLFVRRGADLARFPKTIGSGERFLLNGRLRDGLSQPRVLVATPRGEVYELEPRLRNQTFWITLGFDDGAGRYNVEVQAQDRFGTQVLNLLDVTVGKNAAVPTVRLRPPEVAVSDREEAERRSLALVNATRESYGLPIVKLSAELSKEARVHATDMSTGGFFGHRSPTRGGLTDRLRRVPHALALENIALGPSPEAVHADLVRSPSHLRNLLDPDVTHVGVGVHEDRSGPEPVYMVTQVFVRFRAFKR